MRVVRIAITQAVCTIVTLITPLVSNPSKVRHSRIRSAWRCNVGSGLSCIGPAVAA